MLFAHQLCNIWGDAQVHLVLLTAGTPSALDEQVLGCGLRKEARQRQEGLVPFGCKINYLVSRLFVVLATCTPVVCDDLLCSGDPGHLDRLLRRSGTIRNTTAFALACGVRGGSVVVVVNLRVSLGTVVGGVTGTGVVVVIWVGSGGAKLSTVAIGIVEVVLGVSKKVAVVKFRGRGKRRRRTLVVTAVRLGGRDLENILAVLRFRLLVGVWCHWKVPDWAAIRLVHLNVTGKQLFGGWACSARTSCSRTRGRRTTEIS